ncbi:MAG: hypothetical protein PHN41_00655 [Bacteroidales bacterium]|nr:hypothetical protein [Bacteroidales bacterium]MDD4702843.1 hypothetical protein [Bacteroidales bacterium]MDX9797493.1 hypothetical protein [Bacteroidales bacterium]
MEKNIKGSSEKEAILKLLRNSILDKADFPYPNLDMEADVYVPVNDDPLMVFAENIVKSGGKFIYCKNEIDLIDKLNSMIEYREWENHISTLGDNLKEFLDKNSIVSKSGFDDTCKVGITLCHSVSARDSLITITSNQIDNSKLESFPSILIIIVFTSQIALDLSTALNQTSENSPKHIITLNPSYILREEIKELYLFTVENQIQTN